MKKENSTAAKERRYAQLATRLAKTGLVLQGTITERSIVRDDPKAPGREKRYGPYYRLIAILHTAGVKTRLDPNRSRARIG